MDILVLGNGFDLAHGLPTTYKDFLKFANLMACVSNPDTVSEISFVGIFRDTLAKQALIELGATKKAIFFEELTPPDLTSTFDPIGSEYNCGYSINKFYNSSHYLFNNSERLSSTLRNCAEKCERWAFASISLEELKELLFSFPATPFAGVLKAVFYKRTEFLDSKQLWNDLLQDNFWLQYFTRQTIKNHSVGENWIDFEKEISLVVKYCNAEAVREQGGQLSGSIRVFVESEIASNIKENLEFLGVNKLNNHQLRDKLLDDLNRLSEALDKYLSEFVSNIHIEKLSFQLDGLIRAFDTRIICFNYTSFVYTEYADYGWRTTVSHLHGEAKGTEDTNIVLGIDEYLSGEDKDTQIEYIAFKKFYQRILKQTDATYLEWIKEIEEDDDQFRCGEHRVFIFGHSLDVTDKDVIRALILHNNVYTTIYHHNRDSLAQQIANLNAVLGQDELIRRTSLPNPSIRFVKQEEFIPKGSFFERFEEYQQI